ncbi:hypothetical protein [Halobiforma nitratireducens]|uniref:DUF8173 domain-containing protein n=1 Tax=Halobiforma nitratireducens JCM 10879 TaxID=1227454 RepID=M0LI83_9EURY|nr:hypothetical protein [Halobiforma nitratireducens]EMA33332.1 hypothetical protein C446_13909 [Halobiforma nitratireducens JCM 10879]
MRTRSIRLRLASVCAGLTVFVLAVDLSSTSATGQVHGLDGASVATSAWYLESLAAAGTTAVICGCLLLVAEPETRTVTDRALADPVVSLLLGLSTLVAVVGAELFGLLPVVGSALVWLLQFGYGAALLIAAGVGFLAVGRLAGEDWCVAFPVAVVVAAILPAVSRGELVVLVIGLLGAGAFVVQISRGGRPLSSR